MPAATAATNAPRWNTPRRRGGRSSSTTIAPLSHARNGRPPQAAGPLHEFCGTRGPPANGRLPCGGEELVDLRGEALGRDRLVDVSVEPPGWAVPTAAHARQRHQGDDRGGREFRRRPHRDERLASVRFGPPKVEQDEVHRLPTHVVERLLARASLDRKVAERLEEKRRELEAVLVILDDQDARAHDQAPRRRNVAP